MKNQIKFLTMVLTITLGLILIVGSSYQIVHAQTGMVLQVSAERNSSTLMISGETSRTNDVTITITSPNSNLIFIDQLSPDTNGNFQTRVNTSGFLWKQNGDYKIAAQQGENLIYQLDVKVKIIDEKIKTTKVIASSQVDVGLVEKPADSSKGLTLFVDVIPGATTIPISGHTSSLLQDITITVKAPNGNVISVDQIRPGINGDFEAKINTGSDLWKQDGLYTITAQQGDSPQFKQSSEIEIIDRAVIPEFGTIAVMILAVAIISIIAVSTKSKLSIVPRF